MTKFTQVLWARQGKVDGEIIKRVTGMMEKAGVEKVTEGESDSLDIHIVTYGYVEVTADLSEMEEVLYEEFGLEDMDFNTINEEGI